MNRVNPCNGYSHADSTINIVVVVVVACNFHCTKTGQTLVTYVFVGLQVSLDAQVRETINRKMVNPSSHTFDEAQIQIYTLMQRDSYPRFLNSQTYKRLLGNNSQLSQSPSSTSSPLEPDAQHEPQPQQQQQQQHESGSS